MDGLAPASSGGAAFTPRQSGSQTYMQLALYLAGNALTAVIALLLWNLNSVLADFRDSMLYALLCSIALRPVKEWLVAQLDASLADPQRSVGAALLRLAALPLNALTDAWEEGRGILAKWRLAVQEEFQRRQAALRRAAAAAAASPASPRTPRTAAAAAASAAKATAAPMPSAMPSLAVYGHAAVRVLKSRRTSKKRRKQRQQARRAAEGGSSLLFRWLFRGVAAWLLWEWVRDCWSATVQVVLLVSTTLLALGLVPLLLLTTNRYLAGAVFSPVKTPTGASALQGTGGASQGRSRRGDLQSLSPPRRPVFSPFADLRQRRGGAAGSGRGGGAATPTGDTGFAANGSDPTAAAAAAAAAAKPAAAGGWWGRCHAAWLAAKVTASGLLASLDSGLRTALRSNLHALVSLMLILGLFVGTTGLAAFLSVRVAQEGRDTVLAVRDVFPTAWAGMAASTPLLAEAAAAAAAAAGPDSVPPAGVQGDAGAASAGGPSVPPVVLPAWVASYQQEALQLVQQALPAVASWGEAHFYGFVERQNLTAALGDIRLLYETLQGPRQCGERERQKLAVGLAKAEVALAEAAAAKGQAEQQLSATRRELKAAVERLEAQRQASGSPALSAPPAPPAAAPADGRSSEGDSEGGDGTPSAPPAVPPAGEAAVLDTEKAVVAADAALKAAKQQHKAAALEADAAERERRAAQARLQLCSAERGTHEHHTSLLPGLAGRVAASLQRAYAKLWRRQVREGLAEMRAAAAECVAALRQGIARSGGHGGAAAVPTDLSSLQRLLQAAADPLIAVGRVAGRLFAGSVGSTTAAALMGGLGVLRLGMNVFKFGMQLMLFLALLFYLLAAQSDPLLAAAGVLPLSDQGRRRTAVALNRALGGVLVSSVKLIAFHGCFSWLTFRVMSLPLTYTASVASAVCALLPFVPTYAAALPGCVVLLAQGRLLASILFFALHFMGYYVGDTAILEDIPGGHPYMLSLGILGGIWAFDNPLQGCLLGPILLSLLSVFYTLHSEFMGGGSAGGGSTPAGGPLHRLWSLTPGSVGRQAVGTGAGAGAGQQQQQQHVRMAAGDPSVMGSPDAFPGGLRVSIPVRHATASEAGSPNKPGMGMAGGGAAVGSPEEQQPSASLSLGGPPGSVVGLPASLAAHSPGVGEGLLGFGYAGFEEEGDVWQLGPAGPELGEDEEDGEDGGSPSASASVGESFSFNALRLQKLHDD